VFLLFREKLMETQNQYIPVLHSVSYAGAWPGHTLLNVDSFLIKAAELGYKSVALVAKRPHVSPFDYDELGRKALRKRLHDLGLELAALMGYTDFTAGINRPGIPSAEINAGYVEVLCQLAVDLETPRLRIFTGYERQGVSYDAQYTELLRGLRMATRVAAKYGVTLLVQNHHDLCLHHDQLAWMMKEVCETNCKIAFDAWSPFLEGLSGKELTEAVETVAPWLGWTTVADYVRHPRFRYEPQLVNYVRQEADLVRAVTPGTGLVDYAAFFEGLRFAGYRGHVAYEMCAVLEGGGVVDNLDRNAQAFLEFLKRF
jgi:sugar phosphate isomerase/epimerase